VNVDDEHVRLRTVIGSSHGLKIQLERLIIREKPLPVASDFKYIHTVLTNDDGGR
jgi:hypothetical protein